MGMHPNISDLVDCLGFEKSILSDYTFKNTKQIEEFV